MVIDSSIGLLPSSTSVLKLNDELLGYPILFDGYFERRLCDTTNNLGRVSIYVITTLQRVINVTSQFKSC